MSLTLQSPQCFAIGILIFGLIGFLQGWRRMIVIMGFVLATILFLSIFGAQGLATFFFVRIPQTVSVLTGGAIGPKGTPPPPGSTEVLITEVVTIVIAMILGFVFSNRGFPVLKLGDIKFTAHTTDRFIGVIPGMITGFAVISYFSHLFAANPNIAVGVATPNPNTLGDYIVALVIIAIVVLVIGLLTARLGK